MRKAILNLKTNYFRMISNNCTFHKILNFMASTFTNYRGIYIFGLWVEIVLLFSDKLGFAIHEMIFFSSIGTIGFLTNPKELTRSNIAMMSFITYLFFPLGVSLFILMIITIFFRINIFFALLLVFLIVVTVFILSYSQKVNKEKDIYLEKARISFDIIRLFFLVILTVTTIYSNLLQDFSTFGRMFIYLRDGTLQDLRRNFNLTFQIICFPFIFSVSVTKIMADIIMFRKKYRVTPYETN